MAAEDGTGTSPDAPAAGRPRVRALRSDAKRNRAKLVEAARRSFEAEGLSVPVDEIARRAGVGAGTIHRHFPTKASLFEAIVLDHVGELVERARRGAAADDPGAAFLSFCTGLAEAGTGNKALAQILAVVPDESRVAAAIAAFDDALEALVKRAQETGAIRADLGVAEIRALLDSVHVAAERRPGDGRTAVRLMRVICDGLLVRPG